MSTRLLLDLSKMEGKAPGGGPPLSNADKALLSEMVSHHKAALAMVAKLGTSKNAAVKSLADSIKKTQTGEIATMTKLLGGKVPAPKMKN